MAKFKPARGRKSASAATRPNAIGCIILIALILIFLFASMYFTVRQA